MKRIELIKKRIDFDLSQEKTAEAIGISVGCYSLIEQGKINSTLKVWKKIQKLFQIADADMWAIMANDKENN